MCRKQVGNSRGAPALQGDGAASSGAGVGGLLCQARSSGEKLRREQVRTGGSGSQVGKEQWDSWPSKGAAQVG
jgi:hypothetical protein